MKPHTRNLTIEHEEDCEQSIQNTPNKTKSKTPQTSASCRNNTHSNLGVGTPKGKLQDTNKSSTRIIRNEGSTRRKLFGNSPQKQATTRRSKSRGASPYFTPTISNREAVQKVQQLNQWQSQHNIRLTEMQLSAKEEQRKRLQDRPQIGEASKQLYETVRHRKHLSGNVLHRFEQYEQQKVQHQLDNIILQHFEETHSVPSLKSLLRSHRDQLVRLLRSCSKQTLLGDKHNH